MKLGVVSVTLESVATDTTSEMRQFIPGGKTPDNIYSQDAATRLLTHAAKRLSDQPLLPCAQEYSKPAT